MFKASPNPLTSVQQGNFWGTVVTSSFPHLVVGSELSDHVLSFIRQSRGQLGTLSHSFGLSLWGDIMSSCLTLISTQKFTPWAPLSKAQADEDRVGHSRGRGLSMQGTDAGHLQSQEKFLVGTFCSKPRNPARRSDRVLFLWFSTHACRQIFSAYFTGQEMEAQRGRDLTVTYSVKGQSVDLNS